MSTQATREGAKPKESCLRRWSAIAFLLTQPRDDQTIYTTKYLGAAHEIFVWSLLICWTVSLIFTPEMVFNHPAREATWHFNPCFGWDFPPASYIAVILNSTNVYWTWRYAWLETTRSAMLPETGLQAWAERLASFAAYNLAFASNLWLLLWIIGPCEAASHYASRRWHLADTSTPSTRREY